MPLRATIRTLALTVTLVASAAVCGGWKWENLLP
jgi:hypothetical protein